MDELINDIRKALINKCWYSALALSLTLPDICSYIENPKTYSSIRYPEWFDKYIAPKYTSFIESKKYVFLSGNDCYALRCAYLHQGENDIIKQSKRKYLSGFRFTTAEYVHCNQINDILQVQVDKFCEDICNGATQWINDHKDIMQNNKSILYFSNIINI